MIHICCKVANVEGRVHEIQDNLVLKNTGLAKRLNMFLRYCLQIVLEFTMQHVVFQAHDLCVEA